MRDMKAREMYTTAILCLVGVEGAVWLGIWWVAIASAFGCGFLLGGGLYRHEGEMACRLVSKHFPGFKQEDES